MRGVLAGLLAAALGSVPAAAQSLVTEAEISAGRSTDGTTGAATQVRLFGPIAGSPWRMYLETAWGGSWGPTPSDAFHSVYPYDRRVRPMEMFAERSFHPGGALVDLRAGRYRVPFGISGRSDYAYTGFTRGPLIRYGTDWALSNTFLETGLDVLAGVPRLYAEASVGMPEDAGDKRRRDGMDTVVRVQTFAGSLIAGASYVRTQPSMVGDFVHGRMEFGGVDGRWMSHGVQLRGEWMDGRPLDGVSTRGGYLDAIVHEPRLGWLTGVARVERLDYFAGPFSAFYRRYTIGSLVRLSSAISVEVNLLHQPRRPEGEKASAFDAAVTYSVRF